MRSPGSWPRHLWQDKGECTGCYHTAKLLLCCSPEFTRTLAALLASSEGGGLSNWRQLAAALADRTMEEMDGVGVLSHRLVSRGGEGGPAPHW